jgi:hypothetical protein
MPVVTTPPGTSASPGPNEATIAPDASFVTFPVNAVWLIGDTTNDTPKIEVGDLVYFKGQYGNAIQTVTKKDATHIYFENGVGQDFFGFNPTTPTTGANRPFTAIKQVNPPNPATSVTSSTLCPAPGTTMTAASPFCMPVTMFKAVMITYYVDNSGANATTPRLTRQVNKGGCVGCPPKFDPQALAGVVEDLDLTYDLYDGATNPTQQPTLPVTIGGVLFTESMIRKVNVHMGVRSETLSKPLQDYVRNHISTSVNVRSLTAVDRYNSQ